jgi:hypothetical protein
MITIVDEIPVGDVLVEARDILSNYTTTDVDLEAYEEPYLGAACEALMQGIQVINKYEGQINYVTVAVHINTDGVPGDIMIIPAGYTIKEACDMAGIDRLDIMVIGIIYKDDSGIENYKLH